SLASSGTGPTSRPARPTPSRRFALCCPDAEPARPRLSVGAVVEVGREATAAAHLPAEWRLGDLLERGAHLLARAVDAGDPTGDGFVDVDVLHAFHGDVSAGLDV